MNPDLTLIWAGILAFAILVYVIVDGFDLGVGIQLLLNKSTPQDRDTMIHSIAPVWDGNETWLVLGGGALFAMFPVAYSVILPAIYVPIIVMLLALAFRGVAFEFRAVAGPQKPLWDLSFCFGSTLAAFSQGVALGALVQGIHITRNMPVPQTISQTPPLVQDFPVIMFNGGPWDWLSPFSILTGVSLVLGYGLLGSAWLIIKTEGSLQQRAYRLAALFGVATVAAIIIVSLATPALDPQYLENWTAWPTILFTAIVPILVGLTMLWLWYALKTRKEAQPFFAALTLFILSFIGLGISFYPYIAPPSLTIWESAAPMKSQIFLLVGTLIFVPIILMYTAFGYWVFRGKVNSSSPGYHH